MENQNKNYKKVGIRMKKNLCILFVLLLLLLGVFKFGKQAIVNFKIQDKEFVTINTLNSYNTGNKVFVFKRNKQIKYVIDDNITSILNYNGEEIIYINENSKMKIYNFENKKITETEISEMKRVFYAKKIENDVYFLQENDSSTDLYKYNISNKRVDKILNNITHYEFPLIYDSQIFYSKDEKMYIYDMKTKNSKETGIVGKFPFDLKNNELYFYLNGYILKSDLQTKKISKVYKVKDLIDTPRKVGESMYLFNVEGYCLDCLSVSNVFLFDSKLKEKINIKRIYNYKKLNYLGKEKKKDKVYDIYRETELTYSSYLFY